MAPKALWAERSAGGEGKWRVAKSGVNRLHQTIANHRGGGTFCINYRWRNPVTLRKGSHDQTVEGCESISHHRDPDHSPCNQKIMVSRGIKKWCRSLSIHSMYHPKNQTLLGGSENGFRPSAVLPSVSLPIFGLSLEGIGAKIGCFVGQR